MLTIAHVCTQHWSRLTLLLILFQLDVKEHKKIENHPQWDISEDEDEKADGDLTESEGSSEFDESDDE